jgi:hypothetical protein
MKGGIEMKRILTPILLSVLLTGVCIGLMTHTGCKKSQDTVEYTLSVTVNEGVTGTPQTGDYLQALDDQVDYSYTLSEGYTNLVVTLDNVSVEPSGTITIQGNHSLRAFASQGTGQYLLTVSIATGAAGTPEGGFYNYDAGEQVDYSFTLEDGYTNLRVVLDGNTVDAAGTITISQDHVLSVFAEKEYYIQGSWTLEEAYRDDSTFTVTVTFTGETRTGTVADSDGGVGTYTVDGNNVEFTLVFPDVTYEYTGLFSDEENMSGESKRITAAGTSTGVWTAVINTAESRSRRTSFATQKKGDR